MGSTVAVNNLFIAIARMVYCFDFEEDHERPIDVSRPFPPTGQSAPFQIKIKPRSEAHRQLIERECKDAAMIGQDNFI